MLKSHFFKAQKSFQLKKEKFFEKFFSRHGKSQKTCHDFSLKRVSGKIPGKTDKRFNSAPKGFS